MLPERFVLWRSSILSLLSTINCGHAVGIGRRLVGAWKSYQSATCRMLPGTLPQRDSQLARDLRDEAKMNLRKSAKSVDSS